MAQLRAAAIGVWQGSVTIFADLPVKLALKVRFKGRSI